MTVHLDVAVDTGGTFTDIVLLHDGRLRLHKVPSRPDNPSMAVAQGLKDLGLTPADVRLVHGTTVATNALLERKGARLFLIINEGFEDILMIGRQNRDNLYDLHVTRPEPLIPHRCIAGIPAKSAGESLKKGDVDTLKRALLPRLEEAKPDLVCICLLGSYEDPAGESTLKEFLEEYGFRVVTSHEVLPEFREFERFSTTVLNAYVSPIMEKYIHQLDTNLGLASLQIMQSNGGALSARSIGKESIHTLLSGPAGGVVGARALASHAGYENIITFDMGGTSTDVSLLPGKILYTMDTSFHGWPARIPMIDINTVGAGGGSIAWLDPGGLLKVGPQSAGAKPGPACYGVGDNLTVTDANVFLGRIPAERFLGGRMTLYPDKIRPLLDELGMKCGKTPLEIADGIVTIANQHMLRALRVISIQRGFNPADFVLVTFGGAGGLHAVELARDLGIQKILVAPCAGVLSALGLLLAEVVKNYQSPAFQAFPAETNTIPADLLSPILNELREKAFHDMKTEGFQPDELITSSSVDVRFIGQSWEINIPLRPENLRDDFHLRHRELHGYTPKNRGWEIINVRLQVVGMRTHPNLDKLKPFQREPRQSPVDVRPVIWRNDTVETPFYNWTELSPERTHHGPVVVLDDFSTVWVPPDFQVCINQMGGLEIWPTD